MEISLIMKIASIYMMGQNALASAGNISTSASDDDDEPASSY